MSKKWKPSYTAFSRHILLEFMTEAELKELDRKYTEAKIKRFLRKVGKITETGNLEEKFRE